jgi:HK97 family phage major capsid protein
VSDAAARALAADDKMFRFEQALAEGKSMDEAHRAYLGPARPVDRPDPVTMAGGAQKVAAWLRGASEQKAALVANAVGQVLLPPDLQIDILNFARSYGVIRSLVDPIPTTRLKPKTVLIGDAVTGWGKLEVGGTLVDAAIQPGTPADIEVHDLNSLVQIGTSLLDDSRGEDLRRSLVAVFGAAVVDAEDAAFVAGNGTDRAKGLSHADVITAIPAAQKLTAASPITVANLRRLPFLLPVKYWPSAVWLLSADAAEAVGALVDSGGGPVWPNPGNPRASTGGGLMGFDAYVCPSLPAMTGTNAPSVLFGSVRDAYRIEQRREMTLQRLVQRWAELGLTGALMRHRVGGAVVRPQALAAYLL